ncbi:hypothetical protein GCM10010365_17070 [Streptomyces poonensis]|uniref:Uncharacterized protein n=1 Tax=Streptomyces poonensis TaxID=68255 RepID=A0A918PCK5_9ACTN|nr:hypothetical protein GCM10010365_17070 [Streptomyces poonensis]
MPGAQFPGEVLRVLLEDAAGCLGSVGRVAVRVMRRARVTVDSRSAVDVTGSRPGPHTGRAASFTRT